MEFINYASSRSGVIVGKSNDILRFESRVEDNVKSFLKYLDARPIRFDNSHTLSRLCSNISQYFGANPKQTYELVKEQLRYIANLFSIAMPGIKQYSQPVFLGRDFLVAKSFDVQFGINGGLDLTQVKAFKLYYHDQYSLRIADYLELEDKFSLIGVDLPLFAAIMHEEQLRANSEGFAPNRNKLLSKHFTEAVTMDVINLALLNRFELDSQDISDDVYEESYLSLPYTHYPLTTEYRKVKSDYREFFSKLKRTDIADVNANLPLINACSDEYLLKINDYYLDSLMWLNALSEVNIYNKLTTITEGYDLRLNLTSYENRLKKLIGGSKLDNYIRHLDEEERSYFGNVIGKK